MKTIIRFGVICSFLLLLTRLLTSIPILNLYFDQSIGGAIHFIIIGGVMLFAINHYLKNHNQDNNYKYWLGFIICFSSTLLGGFIYNIIYPMVIYEQFNPILNLPLILSNCSLMLPMAIILSLIIPLTFRSKENKKNYSDNDDILDAEL